MGLPKEFHEQCQWSLEDFYFWAQADVFNTPEKILHSNVTLPEESAILPFQYYYYFYVRTKMMYLVARSGASTHVDILTMFSRTSLYMPSRISLSWFMESI